MNLEAFQLLDNETFDNSIIKRDFPKVCHQQGTNLNDPEQNIEFIFGETNNYHQICNSYLEFDITVRREDNANFTDVSPIGMTNNAFAFCFKEAPLSTTSGGNLVHNKFVGQISTIMRALISKDGDLLLQIDNTNEGNGNADFNSTSLKKMIFDNQDLANKSKIREQLGLEHLFGFCKSLKKVTKT